MKSQENSLLTSLQSSSVEDKIRIIWDAFADEGISAKTYVFLSRMLEAAVKDFPLIALVRLLAPYLRNLDVPSLLEYVSSLIITKFIRNPSDTADELIWTTKTCPQMVPFLLNDICRSARTGCPPSILKYFAFLVNNDWISPFSNSREVLEALCTLQDQFYPAKLAALLAQSMQSLDSCEYSRVNAVSLSITKILKCLKLEKSEDAFILCVDSIFVYCKANEENIVPLLLDLIPVVPESLKPFFAHLLSATLMVENCSPSLIMSAAKNIKEILTSCSWLSIAEFYIGVSEEIVSMPVVKVEVNQKLISYVESDELRVLIGLFSSPNLSPLPESTPFINAVNLILMTQRLITEDSYGAQFFTDAKVIEPEQLMMLFTWTLKARPAQFKLMVSTLTEFGSVNEEFKQFALSVISSLMKSPELVMKLVPILCKLLASHHFLFPLIQSSMPALLTSPTPACQVLFAVCCRRIVAADSRQGHLNFAFNCIKELFKWKEIARDALGLALESLVRLCSIRYVDPKIGAICKIICLFSLW